MKDADSFPKGATDHAAKSLASGGQGLALELDGRLHVMGPRPFEIGRSESSQLVIDHASVSRHHARIVRARDGFEVEDLDSRNGVFVNAERVHGSAPVFPGAVLRFGEVSVLVRTARRAAMEQRTTRRDQPWSVQPGIDEDGDPMGGLLPFMAATDEALSRGDARQAEQLFVRHLARPVERAAQRGWLDAGAAQIAAHLALRLGDATSSDAWLDFVIRLYSEADRVIPLPLVDAMHALAQKLGGVDRGAFRQYTSRLSERASALTSEERLVLERLMLLSGSARGPSRATG